MNAATRAFEAGDFETAVSRAYYAAYHAIIAAFETKMGLPRIRWSHNFRPYFSRYPELDELRPRLLDLYELRTRADYEQRELVVAEAEQAILQGQVIVKRATEVVEDA